MAARFTGNALKSVGECRGGTKEEGEVRETGKWEEFGRAGLWEGKDAPRRRTDGRLQHCTGTDCLILQALPDPHSSLLESLPSQGEEESSGVFREGRTDWNWPPFDQR